MAVRQHPVFNELGDQAQQRGMWAELTNGLRSVRVTDKNRRVLVERVISRGCIDTASSHCLTFITQGTRP
jgi:hypothetical protein